MRKAMGTVLLVTVALAGSVTSSFADDGDGGGCATTLLDCYKEAAKIDNFWYRWAAGIDCELDFVECVRVKLIGT